MRKPPGKTGDNVVRMSSKPVENRAPNWDFSGTAAGSGPPAGSPDDPRMREAVRLMEAFLAIEDAQGRAALITLAERLVSFDWVRRAQRAKGLGEA
jgi:hypothetical protein